MGEAVPGNFPELPECRTTSTRISTASMRRMWRTAFASCPLAELFPYLILDARYEKVLEAGVVASQAVLIAVGID
jgi:transposase-like protein